MGGQWFLQVQINAYKPTTAPLALGHYNNNSAQQGQAIITVKQASKDFVPSENTQTGYFYVNGEQHSAEPINYSQTHRTYALDLPKGDYEIGLDSRNLAVEDKLPTPVVARIQSRLPTYIDWELTQVYGVRGQLNISSSGVSNGKAKPVNMQLWQANKLIKTAVSDQDGYFAFDDLPNGNYQLKANGYVPQAVNIHNNYAMGIMLIKD